MLFKQLKYFQVVAKYNNISHAAEELFISQPALSKSIQQLESEFGVALFTRKGKHLLLNDAGKEALKYTYAILNDVKQLEAQMSKLSDSKRFLNIQTNLPVFMRYIIPLFKLEHPNINVQSLSSPQFTPVESILSGECDMVLSSEILDAKDENICHTLIFRDPRLLSVKDSNPLAKKSIIELADFNGMKIIISKQLSDCTEHSYPHFFYHYLEDRGIHIEYLPQPDYAAYHYLLTETDYCAITSILQNRFDKIPGRKCLSIQDGNLTQNIYLSCLRSNIEKLKPFIDWFVQACHG